MQADAPLTFHVDKIFVNRNGSALLLAGSEGFCVMYLYGRSSMEENIIICRYANICLILKILFPFSFGAVLKKSLVQISEIYDYEIGSTEVKTKMK